jgi:chitodextrinase
VGTSTTTSFTNTGLTASTTYRFQVRARDAAGNLSPVSNTITVTTPGGGGDTTPPSTPGTLSSSNVTSSSVGLSWGASTDNVGVTGYDILRAPGASGGTFAVVGTSTTTSFTNTGLTANTTYRFQVRARDAAGNLSPVSNTVTVTTTGGTGGSSCRVAYSISPWGGTNGFTANLTLTNTATTNLNGWTMTFTLPAGQAITLPGWSATYTPSGQNISVAPLDWNRNLSPNGSTTIGFNGTHTGNTSEPTAFTVNGSACTVV